MKRHFVFYLCLMAGSIAVPLTAQDHHHETQSSAPDATTPADATPSGDMHHHDGMGGMEGGMGDADEQMSHKEMDMGPHMKISTLRPLAKGDKERAETIVQQTRTAIEKYKDVQTAIAEGFKEFRPGSPGKMRHFTNYSNAMAAGMGFDPSKPTSLLYEKNGDDYKLIGVMFTAPKRATEDDLDKRVPLSVAQWHEHVNLCLPPRGLSRQEMRKAMMPPNARFGLAGSIATQEACDAADGRWMPQIFSWMLHMYPYEKDPDAIWSMERQHEQMEHMH